MRRDLLFETGRFNVTDVGEHFINPGCFGEDLAAWLQSKLVARGIEAGAPDQEDWGWYFDATYGGRVYLVGVGGNPADPPDSAPEAVKRNWAEWRIILEPHRSVSDRFKAFFRRSAADDSGNQLLDIVRSVLEAEADFYNVQVE